MPPVEGKQFSLNRPQCPPSHGQPNIEIVFRGLGVTVERS